MESEHPLEVDVHAVQRKRANGEKFVLLDCREEDEFQIVRIEGSRLMPLSQLETRVGELDEHKDDEIIVHCHHGGRSLRAAKWLRAHGFEKVSSMAGGIDDWAVKVDSSLGRY
jgi:rhodanese-related sulfurtransferase